MVIHPIYEFVYFTLIIIMIFLFSFAKFEHKKAVVRKLGGFEITYEIMRPLRKSTSTHIYLFNTISIVVAFAGRELLNCEINAHISDDFSQQCTP